MAPAAAPLTPDRVLAISRVYDPLYRLKEVNYSNGQYFHYTYDADGNRKTQVVCIGTPTCTPAMTGYDYDIANRLTSVDGVTYTWASAEQELSCTNCGSAPADSGRLTSPLLVDIITKKLLIVW